jgi:hypothetical protein
MASAALRARVSTSGQGSGWAVVDANCTKFVACVASTLVGRRQGGALPYPVAALRRRQDLLADQAINLMLQTFRQVASV